MADNYAAEWTDYEDVVQRRDEIKDKLIRQILNEYLAGNDEHDEDDDILPELETETDPIHIQVIQEIEKGIPMQIDEIPESATPITSNSDEQEEEENLNLNQNRRKSSALSDHGYSNFSYRYRSILVSMFT